MADFRILVQRSKRVIGQRFWVSIQAANGKNLFHSEQYKSQSYARELGHQMAQLLDANFIDLS